MAAPMEVSLPQSMLQKLLDLLQLESLKFCVDWSILRDLLGAAICGELPELSETDAERSTGVPLLSAAESIAILTYVDTVISNKYRESNLENKLSKMRSNC